MPRHAAGLILLVLLAAAGGRGWAAADYAGQVTFGGVPIPGAKVTATLGETTVATITDADGVYRFAGLAEGVWRVRVEMLGFEPAVVDVTIPPPAGGAPPVSELTLLPIEQIVGVLPAPRPAAAPPAAGTSSANRTGPDAGTAAA